MIHTYTHLTSKCCHSNIIEEIGEKIFDYLFLNKDLRTTLEHCQKSAQKYLS